MYRVKHSLYCLWHDQRLLRITLIKIKSCLNSCYLSGPFYMTGNIEIANDYWKINWFSFVRFYMFCFHFGANFCGKSHWRRCVFSCGHIFKRWSRFERWKVVGTLEGQVERRSSECTSLVKVAKNQVIGQHWTFIKPFVFWRMGWIIKWLGRRGVSDSHWLKTHLRCFSCPLHFRADVSR